ncbi:MAG: hypothetical protein NW224_09685 [Leptolyngbyaceae cyanobacterium bins.302]|nr:hypothetical protein [Leptolyngbyaceae cyanobacterium bins.302]
MMSNTHITIAVAGTSLILGYFPRESAADPDQVSAVLFPYPLNRSAFWYAWA